MAIPLTPDQIIKGAEAAIDAGATVAKLATNSRKHEKLRANQAIGQLAVDARRLCQEHLDELRAIKQKLKNAGVLGLPADKIVGEVGWWRARKYLAVRNYNHKIEGILNSLGDLQQEMIAIAHCIEAESWVAESAEEALAAARERGKLLDSDEPVGKVLDRLIKEAQDLVVNGFKPKKKSK
jgi:hypothetical protein